MSTPNVPQQPGQSVPPQAAAYPQHSTTQPTTPLPQGAPQQAYAVPQQQPQQVRPQAQQPYQAAYPQRPTVPAGTKLGETNTYAFLAIIFAFLSPIAGIVFGHMGLSQIKRTGDAGRGLALTGLILSYAYFALLLFVIIAYVSLIVAMISSLGALGSGYYSDYSY